MKEKIINIRSSDDQLAALDVAAKALKDAGFVLAKASRKSEACYYALPGRRELLRLATHRLDYKSRQAFGKIVRSCVTFADGRITHIKVLHEIARGIGFYMMNLGDSPQHPQSGRIRDMWESHEYRNRKAHHKGKELEEVLHV